MQKYKNPNLNGKPLVDCIICGERKPHESKGMCYTCYRKQRKPKMVICENCKREAPHHGNGLCSSCHTRLRHYDKVLTYNSRKNFGIDLQKYKELTNSCKSCGFDKIVELHHLDSNKENNNLSNLIPLCPNCHKMIHNHQFYKEILENIKDSFDITQYRPRRLNKEYGKALY